MMSNDLIPRSQLAHGDHVECPIRSSVVGPHNATVTHVDSVGTDLDPRSVVSLDCGHHVNMRNGHGLYAATLR